MNNTSFPFITTLLHGKSNQEIEEAQQRFSGFLSIAERIYERIKEERSR